MKAFIFDPIWDTLVTDELLGRLHSAGIVPVIIRQPAPLAACAELFEGEEPRLLAINPDYVGWKLTAADYRDIPNLRGIFGAATSYGWIDRSHADQHGIPVCNIRNFSTQAVAEWAITMMMNLARQIPRLIKAGFPLDFDQDFMRYRGIELRGKTAGIIGLGHIGRAIAERCAGLGMKVLYWSRTPKETPWQGATLADIFRGADVVFPTLADTPAARGLITPELLGSMKGSALLVSIVHGIFDEALVIDMVKRGALFGFGFEAKAASFAAYEGNVWAAPAYAWATDGAMNNSMAAWVQNMVEAAAGRFPNRVG